MTRSLERTSSGRPSAIFSPWSSTVMRSETPMTTFMSCSMSRMVSPRSSRSCLMNAVSLADSWVFMPAVGSSSTSPSTGSGDMASVSQPSAVRYTP